MELAVLAAVVLLVAGTSHASFCNANGVADSVNKCVLVPSFTALFSALTLFSAASEKDILIWTHLGVWSSNAPLNSPGTQWAMPKPGFRPCLGSNSSTSRSSRATDVSYRARSITL
eukprot:TRINITY_DN1624_c0_g1_i1.p3 TRINITY_DN1624_c0_g1~~TRINITY_DN1624_c0_g1_i1.p3  ORF type:complete len:116 (-),score=13.21 TRINITY_DN1624_c0_g1_i1:2237-2584(-)